ncbi:MAG: hypothetical protein H6696_20075 [Deferribacteres bacterium]|nr:hypothetical protein [candidate division KSB1 bacterium]MCB9504228.1 hypothetical protein [Deferribacteres bacterium]
MKRLLAVLIIFVSLVSFVACDKDSDSGTNNNTEKAWVGVWLSSGTNVAPILVTLFNYDSVRVTIESDNTVKTESHIAGGAWSSVEGVYTVTESSSGDVHTVEFVYAAFSQAGIMQVTGDNMQLEVVQTVPDIGATPRTPATGFGSDAALGALNIQKYVRQ